MTDLKQKRLARNLQQTDLADLTGLSTISISLLETTEHPNPTLSTITKIENVIGPVKWK